MSVFKIRCGLPLVAMFLLSTVIVVASTIQKPPAPVSEGVNVKARPQAIWLSILEARTADPGLTSCKMLSENGRRSVLKETFMVPVLGDVGCTLSLLDSPPNRMDYKLINSDTFTTFDGSWVMTPGANEHSTRLVLSCDAVPKRAVPPFFLHMVIDRKVKKRLDFVKTLAERKEIQMQTVALGLGQQQPSSR